MARYWAGLPLLVRLSEAGTELSSGDVGALLGTRSVKGIGAALSGTRDTLFAAGKEVYNGDIGLVADVDPEAGELTARFEGRDLVYGFGELDTLVPAYAATVHKSQGSEYPAVVIPVLTQHYAMLRRNLLYTGVTRGKRLVVLVGQKKAVAIAVRNASGRRRWSKLDEWLAGPTGVAESGFLAGAGHRRERR